jgi:tyrosinase
MRFHDFPTAVLALAGTVQSLVIEKRDLLSDLQNRDLENLKAAEKNGTLERTGECSISTATVRKDW